MGDKQDTEAEEGGDGEGGAVGGPSWEFTLTLLLIWGGSTGGGGVKHLNTILTDAL